MQSGHPLIFCIQCFCFWLWFWLDNRQTV